MPVRNDNDNQQQTTTGACPHAAQEALFCPIENGMNADANYDMNTFSVLFNTPDCSAMKASQSTLARGAGGTILAISKFEPSPILSLLLIR